MVGQRSELRLWGAYDPLKPWRAHARMYAPRSPSLALSRTLFLVFGDTKPTKLVELSSFSVCAVESFFTFSSL